MFHCSRPVLRPSRGRFEVACRDGSASDSRQGGFEVHGQDGGANPHLRTLHTMVSDTVQPAVVLSVAEGTLNAVALPLLFLEPAFRGFPVVFRTTQGFEGEARTPRSFSRIVFKGHHHPDSLGEGLLDGIGQFAAVCVADHAAAMRQGLPSQGIYFNFSIIGFKSNNCISLPVLLSYI